MTLQYHLEKIFRLNKDDAPLLIEAANAYKFSSNNQDVYISGDQTAYPKVSIHQGRGNAIIVGYGAKYAPEFHVTFKGADNTVFIGPKSNIGKSRISISGDGNTFAFGAFSTAPDLTVQLSGNERVVQIGDFCMLSNRIIMTSTDGHAIYDVPSGNRINLEQDLRIGNHVWIGRDVLINKGSVVGNDTVVGQGSLVTGILDANAIYVGVPARKVREDTNWSRMKAETWSEMEASERHQAFLKSVEHLQARIDNTH